MNPRNAPLSPVSVGGSEFSNSVYNSRSSGNGPLGGGREPLSPPTSGIFTGNMNGFPPGPKSVGGPSPPPSIAGRTSYARSESGRSIMGDSTEAVLGEHYFALKRFLAATSKDGRAQPPPNKARDKLLRLSSVQFLELSTDVFDELLRRQAAEAFRRRPPNASPSAGPPAYLLPEDTFHPKRNQARQKLSTLGPPRFRDLATDVFCELERRIPRVIAGEMPRMGTPRGSMGSRAGTPVNGMPPRGPGGMRRPSDASSIRSAGPPRVNGDYPVPPSPGLSNGNFDRPQPRQFQSNTIVPNKSTMIEEDDDVVGSNDGDNEFGMDQPASNRQSKRSAGTSDTDKKLIDDYQVQVRELREKLDSMEDQMKKKEDEMNNMLDEERSRATVSNSEKQEWDDLRITLENKVAEAQNLNDSMRDELDRLRDDYDKVRDDHAMESRKLREELEDAQQNQNSRAAPGGGDPNLMRENEELRMALENQQRVTEDARLEARQFLQEMKILSEQHSPAWERQAELEKTVEKLEQEVKDWTNRYARTKTQLRDLRASSTSLTVDQDAAKYLREKGFVEDNGSVKDIHVTKFQISIDELLRRARTDDPDKVIDSMKAVVVSVRRITKDIDGAPQHDEEGARQQQKLKARVSATANNLITASKNFASSAGLSPVSLLDAAASHLVAALVELFRAVKIRPTPADELEEEDDGTITPVDSTAFFSNRSTQQEGFGRPQDSPLAPPPPFQGGLRGAARDSAQSSAYSSASSPRQSENQYQNGMNGNGGYMNGNGNGNRGPQTNGGYHQDTNTEDLIIYLSNQKDVVVQTSQGLVNLVRGGEASTVDQFTDAIASIAQVVDRVVSEMEAEPSSNGMAEDMVERLSACRERLLEAGDSGRNIAEFRDRSQSDEDDKKASAQWRMWIQTLPPIAFKIVHQMDELIAALGGRPGGVGGGDDFS